MINYSEYHYRIEPNPVTYFLSWLLIECHVFRKDIRLKSYIAVCDISERSKGVACAHKQTTRVCNFAGTG